VDAAYAATQGTSRGEPVYERMLSRSSGNDPLGVMPPSCEGALDAPGCLTTEDWNLLAEWVTQGTPQ
jgi:hypothetical protein